MITKVSTATMKSLIAQEIAAERDVERLRNELAAAEERWADLRAINETVQTDPAQFLLRPGDPNP